MKISKAVVLTFSMLTFALPATLHAAPTSTKYQENDLIGEAKQHIKYQDYDAAIVNLKKAVTKDENNADAYNLLGYSHRKLKMYDLAEVYYRKALAIDPKHVGALEYLGELYVETNRMDKANQMLARLDEACFFSCSEYKQLKVMIDDKHAGVVSKTDWEW